MKQGLSKVLFPTLVFQCCMWACTLWLTWSIHSHTNSFVLKCCYSDLQWTHSQHDSEQLTSWRCECFPSVYFSQCSDDISGLVQRREYDHPFFMPLSFGTAVMVQANAEKSWISVCYLFSNPAVFQKQYQLLLCHDPGKLIFLFVPYFVPYNSCQKINTRFDTLSGNVEQGRLRASGPDASMAFD